jgi:hypothetical protein
MECWGKTDSNKERKPKLSDIPPGLEIEAKSVAIGLEHICAVYTDSGES